MQATTLITNATIATMSDNSLGLIDQGALAMSDTEILWVGPASELPENYTIAENTIDAGGKLLTPGLVDCHTHLVWAGSRAEEFRKRLHGVSYKEIAEQGGGILSTVKATRAASEDELFELTRPRAEALISQGVTQIEVKSGYGLTLEDELKQLRVARRLGRELPVSVRTTLLAAHALPPEYKEDADGYIDYVCNTILPAAAKENLADAVDVFCENIGFSREQTEQVFNAAKAHGLPVKLHAEQLSDQDGAALVAKHKGLSADHLEYLSEHGIREMAKSGTVGVLLPGAFYFLRETKLPPIQQMRDAGVPIAIATDANPGSSPFIDIQLMMHMSCTLFRMTPEEAWLGVTRNAAKALGETDRGVLKAGNKADVNLWNISSPAEICYQFGINPLAQRWCSEARR